MIIGLIALIYGILKLMILCTNKSYILSKVDQNVGAYLRYKALGFLLFDSLITVVSGLTILLL